MGKATHGMFGTRIYGIWSGLKARCENPNYHAYKEYGGRGITICREWQNDFQAFYDWAMANGYRDDLTIDRKDNDGNYEPSNCRWATQKEQANNRRSNHLLSFNGETHTLTDWATITGIYKGTLRYRIAAGWSVEKALTSSIPQKGLTK